MNFCYAYAFRGHCSKRLALSLHVGQASESAFWDFQGRSGESICGMKSYLLDPIQKL